MLIMHKILTDYRAAAAIAKAKMAAEQRASREKHAENLRKYEEFKQAMEGKDMR